MFSKSERTRHLIVKHAASLFNKKGFAGTSMEDIMQATGLSKGGIYGNFKKEAKDKKGVKEEIAIAAFKHAVDTVNSTIRERTLVIDNTIDKLKTVVYFYKERILNPPVEGGCPVLNASIEADDNHPVLREWVVKIIDDWRSYIERSVQKGKSEGTVRQDVDEAEFAVLFIGMLEGGIMLSRVYKKVELFNLMAKKLLDHIDSIRPLKH